MRLLPNYCLLDRGATFSATNCHCETKPIDDPIAGINCYAECDERKFKEYAFIPLPKDDKSGWFLKYGYDIMDTDYLMQKMLDKRR